MKKLISILVLLLCALQAYAVQEIEVEVIDQNFNSSNRVVITKEQIRLSHAKNLAELISSEANISVASTSFQPNSIYLRGGDSSHVLFLIDGIPFYDASTVQRTINLNTLDLKSIQKIEIIKGSQSVIYGGQALSGVIKIETLPTKLSDSAVATFEATSNSHKSGLNTQNKISDNEAIALNVSRGHADDLSPVKNSSRRYPEDISSADIAYLRRDGDRENILKLQYNKDNAQIATTDYPSYLALDTNNLVALSSSVNLSWILRAKDKYAFSVSNQNTRRLYTQNAYDGNGTETNDDYRSKLQVIRFDYKIVNTNFFDVLLGYNYTHEELKYNNGNNEVANAFKEYHGAYIKAAANLTDNLLFEVGLRDEHNTKDNIATTYQAGITGHVPSLKTDVKLEYSTGFKTPSLFQFYSSYGNAQLAPEKSKSTALSFESKPTDHSLVSLTFFDTEFSNLIVISGSPQKYQNISSARTQGLELYSSVLFPEAGTNVTASLGYQEPIDHSTGKWLVRRPVRTASLKLSQNLNQKADLAAEVIHTGDRRDKAGSAYYTLNQYTLLNALVQWQATQQMKLFSRVDNVTAQEYQTAYGFYSSETVYKFGIEYNFLN